MPEAVIVGAVRTPFVKAAGPLNHTTAPELGRLAVRELFDMSPTRYYQVLNALIDEPAALAHDPMLVKRLRRLRQSRQRARTARRLASDA